MQPKSEWPDYLLAYGLIAVSGIEYFYGSPEFMLIFLLVAVAVAVYRRTPLTAAPLGIIATVFLVELLQASLFNNFVPMSLITILVRLSLAYLVVHVCGIRLIHYYTQLLYWFAIISLPIYGLTFFPAVEQFLIQNVAKPFFSSPFGTLEPYGFNPNMILYTFNPLAEEKLSFGVLKRNSGPFWEPGAFGVFLNLALTFSIMQDKRLATRRNGVLLLTLLTTISTAGYLTLFVIAMGYILTSPALKPAVKGTVLLILFPLFLTLYTQTQFLSGKVKQNVSMSTEDSSSRFGSAFFDLMDISRSPLIGFGRLAENRFGQAARSGDLKVIHRNNGITYLMVTYGLPLFLAYFTLLFLFFKRYTRWVEYRSSFGLVAFLSLLSSGFSQGIFDRAFLLALLFLAIRLRQASQQPAPRVRTEWV
ncbi:hypothetical protein [Tellurirhabdus rosea]|uniref:hypothetical protein n=1 Tax=Tellurirhabdus rosea TaxID=2674997 RepID=UPI002252C752|nr:hypothetical protein [Tellurirhabdus rosea]